MSNQIFSNLQFGSLLKNSFCSIFIDWGDTIIGKISCLCCIKRLVLTFLEKSAAFNSNRKTLLKSCFNTSRASILFSVSLRREKGFGALAQDIGRAVIGFLN